MDTGRTLSDLMSKTEESVLETAHKVRELERMKKELRDEEDRSSSTHMCPFPK